MSILSTAKLRACRARNAASSSWGLTALVTLGMGLGKAAATLDLSFTSVPNFRVPSGLQAVGESALAGFTQIVVPALSADIAVGLAQVGVREVVPSWRQSRVHKEGLAGEVGAATKTGEMPWRLSAAGNDRQINGEIPTESEAIELINEAGGTVNRIEGVHVCQIHTNIPISTIQRAMVLKVQSRFFRKRERLENENGRQRCAEGAAGCRLGRCVERVVDSGHCPV